MMTGFRIVKLSDHDGPKQWDEAIADLPTDLQDVHSSAGYAMAQRHLSVEPVLAVYEAHGYHVVQPFALRKVSLGGIDAMDVANLYGYGGPVTDHWWQLYAWFHKALLAWFRENGIVSEFCALNPMLGEHQPRLIRGYVDVHERKPVVVMDLSRPPGDGYRARRKAGVKAALKAGVHVAAVSGGQDDAMFSTFVGMYDETMRRQGAASRWFFPFGYFRDLCRIGTLFVANMGGRAEAAALMLTSPSGDAYYHHAANALINPKVGANDLLVHEMAEYARRIGMRRLHLGGGVTSAPNDSVLAYKSGFSDRRLATMSYFRVIDQAAYEQLCAAKRAQEIAETGAEFTSEFMPMYRREAS